MAEVFLHQPHTFSFYGNPKSDASSNFYNDELSTDMEAPEWLAYPSKLSDAGNESALRTQTLANTGPRSSSHQRANNSLSALPAFTFNPGQAATSRISDPPAAIAVSAPTTPARHGRHRRAASELIGGTARIGMNTNHNGSPNHGEKSSILFPSTTPFGSLPSRLEYKHRRTGTMTTHDFVHDVSTPPTERSSSSPMSENEIVEGQPVPEVSLHLDDEASLCPPSPLAKPRMRPHDTKSDASHLPKTPVRHRVGFSDTLEFIPRPLSTISSESGSSMSTVRAHSISGSISSVMCSGTSSPLSKRVLTPKMQTIDATEMASEARSLGTSVEHIPASSSVTSERSDHVQEPSFTGTSRDGPYQRYTERVLPQESARATDSKHNTTMIEAPKQRKVGPWNAFLGRKSKPELALHCSRTSAVPIETAVPADLASFTPVELSEDFDTDPTSIIISDSTGQEFTPPITPPVTPNERKKSNENSNATAISHVIDLDAALCCEGYHDGRAYKGRSFSEARRSMHSNAVASGILSSSVHRRADSAPTLTGISFDPCGFLERNSSISSFKRPHMEDVFEEDEDDNPQKNIGKASVQNRLYCDIDTHNNMGMSSPEMDSLPTTPSDATGTFSNLDFSSRKLRFDAPWKSSRDGRDDCASYTSSEPTEMTQNDFAFSDNSSASRNSGNFVKTTSDAYLFKQRKSGGSDTFPLPNRYNSGFVLRTGSPLPSSTCGCGNDCSILSRQDIGAIHGMGTRKPYAQSVGERGSEIRYSVDDVPSLVSSGSTVVSSAHARAPSSSRSFAPRSTSSSLSLSSAIEHRRKRSSIVSFSRLVGSPFTERPRIALEPGKRWQTPLEVEEFKQLKPSRLSRILKFWKPKETHA